MSRNVRKWIVVAGCLGIIGAVRCAFGVTPDDEPVATGPANPYSVIVDKNIFRLNPPPPKEDPVAETKPADLPQYKLTGIVNISGQTRVFFALAPKDAKEAPTYLSLAPGERQGALELVSINRDKEEVAVLNSGAAMTLSVRSNSLASAAGAAPAPPTPAGGSRRLPGFPAPPPPPAPAAAPAPAPAASGGDNGVVIIGGGDGGAGNANNGAAANYTPQGNSGYNGGGYNPYGGSGISVSGASPAVYGGGAGVGATIATPNGTVPLTLGSSAPQGQSANWPPTEAADPVTQAAELLAASQGLDNPKNASGAASKTGPPMPPIIPKQ